LEHWFEAESQREWHLLGNYFILTLMELGSKPELWQIPRRSSWSNRQWTPSGSCSAYSPWAYPSSWMGQVPKNRC
jgi:hypothetical protein